MTDEAELLSLPPYGLLEAEKHAFLTRELIALSRLHAQRCPAYARCSPPRGRSLIW
jgi:hypothetical protein